MPKRLRAPTGSVWAKRSSRRTRRPRALMKRYKGLQLTQNTVYTFNRSVYSNQPINVGATGQYFNFGICANLNTITMNYVNGAGTAGVLTLNIPGANDFPSLFDQWKIERITMKVIPRVNVIDQNASTSLFPAFPNIMYTPDYDDASAISRDILSQRNTHTLALLDKIRTFSVRPKTSITTWSGNLLTGSSAGTQYVDIASSGVDWYGMKGSFGAYANATADLCFDILFAFKGAR